MKNVLRRLTTTDSEQNKCDIIINRLFFSFEFVFEVDSGCQNHVFYDFCDKFDCVLVPNY